MTMLGLVVLSGVAAGGLVLVCARTGEARALWWAATLAAGAAAVLGALGPAPVAVAVAGTGLATAAVVDAAERRIPTALAHGTALLSFVALGGYAWRSAEWATVAAAVALTGIVVAVCGALWLAGRMGFGDVRLAATTVTGALAGPIGTVTLLSGAFVTAGCAALLRRRRVGRDGGSQPGLVPGGAAVRRLPFAPALAAGWLLAVMAT